MSTPSKPLPTTPCRSGSSTAYQPLSEASLKRLVEHAVKGAVAQAVDQVLAHRFAYEQNLRAKQERKADELQAKMGNLSTQLEQLQGNLSTQVEQLQAQLTAQDARADDYKRKMEGFEQQIARYQQQSGRREAQLEKYEQRLEAREGRIERRLHEMEEREARTKKEVSDMRQELNGSSLRLESGLGGLVAAFNGVQDSLASETNRSFFWVHNKCQELLDTTKTSYSNELNKVFDTVIELSERAHKASSR
ncbi:RHTO0S09e06678g1_1 [Rhodotorula toruloides]|uniref:RHTO0S09e06678g1_1 n=1 Tax=Rhodotorula toruloides TaxID=5286 RepID=A0A061B487_RHOTO|nr:RHTO0S09e06678g1_1 [Rhodotorula toruloides]